MQQHVKMTNTEKAVRLSRRTVSFNWFDRNAALFATYDLIEYEFTGSGERPTHVVVQRKPEFVHIPYEPKKHW